MSTIDDIKARWAADNPERNAHESMMCSCSRGEGACRYALIATHVAPVMPRASCGPFVEPHDPDHARAMPAPELLELKKPDPGRPFVMREKVAGVVAAGSRSLATTGSGGR